MMHANVAMHQETTVTPHAIAGVAPLSIVELPVPEPAASLTIFELPLTIFEVPGPQVTSTTWAQRLQPWLRKLGFLRLLPGNERRMRVSETLNLGEKRFVSLVEIDGVSLLIGGGSGGVQLLTKLDEAPLPKSFQSEIDGAWRQRGTA